MALTVYIPDVVNPVVLENADENLSLDEIKNAILPFYPVVENATMTRQGSTVRFARQSGGSKG